MPAKPITPSLGKNPGGAFWRNSWLSTIESDQETIPLIAH